MQEFIKKFGDSIHQIAESYPYQYKAVIRYLILSGYENMKMYTQRFLQLTKLNRYSFDFMG